MVTGRLIWISASWFHLTHTCTFLNCRAILLILFGIFLESIMRESLYDHHMSLFIGEKQTILAWWKAQPINCKKLPINWQTVQIRIAWRPACQENLGTSLSEVACSTIDLHIRITTATAAIDRMWQSNTIRFATTYTLYKSLVVLILACFFVLILQMLVTCWYAWRQTSGVVRTRMFTCKHQRNCIYIYFHWAEQGI